MITVILAALFGGVLLTLFVQFLLFRRWFSFLPVLGPKIAPQYDKYVFPKILLDLSKDPAVKARSESCVCLSLILQFLFHELKDTSRVRRWLIRKLNIEMAELMHTTAGRLIDKIMVRDFSVGTSLPVFRSVTLQNISLGEKNQEIEEVSVLVDLAYTGGFKLAVDVDLLFSKSAYLSIKLVKLEGTGRLQFTRTPYTHWSFMFVQEPVLDFEVESQLDGRPIYQTISLIISQEFVLDKCEEVIIVDVVSNNSPASAAGFLKNDIITMIGGTKVLNSQQATKQFKLAGEKITVRIERSPAMKNWDPFVRVPVQTWNTSSNVSGVGVADVAGPTVKSTVDTPSTSKAVSTADPGTIAPQTTISENEGVRRRLSESRNFKTESNPQQNLRHLSAVGIPTIDFVQAPPMAASKEDVEIPKGTETSATKTDTVRPPRRQLKRYGIDLQKTKRIEAAKEVTFDESFTFKLNDSHKYLNVCLWCRLPEKLDKQLRVIKTEKTLLMGHVSVSLMDVALECLTTLQGRSEQLYHFTPAENKPTASRPKTNIASHPGFDDRLCHGDIRMAFTHTPAETMTHDDRAKVDQVFESNESVAEVEMLQEKLISTYLRNSKPDEEKHDFVMTTFQTATYCKFCKKKIWLKAAFKCSRCSMTCHKKCMEKCQLQTICNRETLSPASADPIRDISPSRTKIESSPKSFLRRFTREPVEGIKLPSRETSPTPSWKAGHSPPHINQANTKLSRRGSDSDDNLTSEKKASSPTGSDAEEALPSGNLRWLSAPGHNLATGHPKISSPLKKDLFITEPSVSSSSKYSTPNAGANDLAAAPSLLSLPANLRHHIRRSSAPEEAVKVDHKLTDCSEGLSRSHRLSSSLEDLHDADDSVSHMRTDIDGQLSDSSEDELDFMQYIYSGFKGQPGGEQIMNIAKAKGRELYTSLEPNERREKLESMINKLQMEIDSESVGRSDIYRQQQLATDARLKTSLGLRLKNVDEKIESLALLMLHYCSGLQHCVEQQDELAQQLAVDRAGMSVSEQQPSTLRSLVPDEVLQELLLPMTTTMEELDDQEQSNKLGKEKSEKESSDDMPLRRESGPGNQSSDEMSGSDTFFDDLQTSSTSMPKGNPENGIV